MSKKVGHSYLDFAQVFRVANMYALMKLLKNVTLFYGSRDTVSKPNKII